MKLNTYLNFGGNCEQAFRFYEARLGGEITQVMRRGEKGIRASAGRAGNSPSSTCA